MCIVVIEASLSSRALGGIPVLVELVGNAVPEVHRSACGALRNLSYGKSNDENKVCFEDVLVDVRVCNEVFCSERSRMQAAFPLLFGF